MPRPRLASHAGLWYSSTGPQLAQQIEGWMADADVSPTEDGVRAIIGPHAGYQYCGHIMAHAYKAIQPANVKRIFLLGPSHHKYSSHCLLSQASSYSTPLGDINVDHEVYAELQKTGHFRAMDPAVDEAEHSLELHMPFIAHVFRNTAVTLVPIMVGALGPESEARYGGHLAPYLADSSNLFVVSSDFCHWGSRFQYTFFDEHQGPIYKSIEWLDRAGMNIIESGSPEDFTEYLEQYNNTICGRHPISILLQALKAAGGQYMIKFNAYDQSSHCTTVTDSSVSYASALVTAKPHVQ